MPRFNRKPKDMETFRKLLKQHGLKATAQRIAVHGVMMEMIHATAESVYDKIKNDGSCKITQSSVYNILTSLADEGIYGRRLSANNKMYFDINSYRHAHLYDTRNHVFVDVEADEMLASAEQGLKRRRFRGYKIDDFEVLILCHPTRKKLL
ncbi:MAG: transcriptional repressor [Bacteroidales bacterium]|nr:transcriptional repressor [Bacteroidales bacterium]